MYSYLPSTNFSIGYKSIVSVTECRRRDTLRSATDTATEQRMSTGAKLPRKSQRVQVREYVQQTPTLGLLATVAV